MTSPPGAARPPDIIPFDYQDPAGPVCWFARLHRALVEGDRGLEREALAKLASYELPVAPGLSWRKGKNTEPETGVDQP